MNPPKTVKVGSARYKVQVTPEIDLEQKLGVTQPRISLIVLSPNQSPPSMRDTLVHEVLHAVCNESGLCHALGIDETDEERMVRILAPWILGLVRDNQPLLQYLRTA